LRVMNKGGEFLLGLLMYVLSLHYLTYSNS
jgi:hypothetical protein